VEGQKEGEVCDGINEKCMAYLVCNGGVCAKWGSVSNGEEAMDMRACVNAYGQSAGIGGRVLCQRGPKFYEGDNNWCEYSVGGKIISVSPSCGFNHGGSFCPSGQGDPVYIKNFQKVLVFFCLDL
jgi:hypothetical protein